MVVSNPFMGLIYSQMILSIQLPITIFLQVYLTSSEKVMGKYKNCTSTKWILYFLGGIVTLLNLMLLISFFWCCKIALKSLVLFLAGISSPIIKKIFSVFFFFSRNLFLFSFFFSFFSLSLSLLSGIGKYSFKN